MEKSIDYYRNCQFVIRIEKDELNEIDYYISQIRETSADSKSKEVKASAEEAIKRIEQVREKVIKDIDANIKELERFKDILRSCKEGQCKQYITDYVLNELSNKDIADKYLYVDPASVNKLKHRAAKLWNKTIKLYDINNISAGVLKNKRGIA